MVLLAVTDPSDPVTSLWVSPDNLLLGTASGCVRLFFRTSSEARTWQSVLLCKRSPEAIAGLLMNDQNEVFAVVGDVGILRWDLRTLEYDKPLVKGCRHDRVDFAMEHKWNHCPHSTTFLDASEGNEPRIVVIRQNGECCLTDLNKRSQQLMDSVGPLPEMDTKTVPYAFDGNRVVYVTKRYGGKADLRLYKVWDGSQDLRLYMRIEARKGPLKGIRMLNSEFIAVLLNTTVYFWSLKTNTLIPLDSCPKVEIFDFIKTKTSDGTDSPTRVILVGVTIKGVVFMGDCIGMQESTKRISFSACTAKRKQGSVARFHLDYPYCITSCLTSQAVPIILYNDDVGLHLEEDMFQL